MTEKVGGLVIAQENTSLLLSSEAKTGVGAYISARGSATLTSMAAPGFITREISSSKKSHYGPTC